MLNNIGTPLITHADIQQSGSIESVIMCSALLDFKLPHKTLFPRTTERQTDRHADKRTDKRTDRQIDIRTGGWVGNGRTYFACDNNMLFFLEKK